MTSPEKKSDHHTPCYRLTSALTSVYRLLARSRSPFNTSFCSSVLWDPSDRDRRGGRSVDMGPWTFRRLLTPPVNGRVGFSGSSCPEAGRPAWTHSSRPSSVGSSWLAPHAIITLGRLRQPVIGGGLNARFKTIIRKCMVPPCSAAFAPSQQMGRGPPPHFRRLVEGIALCFRVPCRLRQTTRLQRPMPSR